MSTRMSFHIFVESKDLELLRRVLSALDFDPMSSDLVVEVSPELPGCWLTPNDASRGVTFWGALEEAVPEDMVRWWEVSICEFADSEWVRAYAPNGKQRWKADFEKGIARIKKELGLGEGLVPNPWGELESVTASAVLTGAGWEEELAALLSGRKRKAKKPEQDPHEAWFARDEQAMLKRPKELVAAAPKTLERLDEQLDYAEALWRCGRQAAARKVLAKDSLVGDVELKEALEAMPRGAQRKAALELFFRAARYLQYPALASDTTWRHSWRLVRLV